MKTVVISEKDFAAIAERDESHFFDTKESAVSGKALQKAVCAFSNADGGELIIGIKDKRANLPLGDRWEGIADIESLNSHLQAVFEIRPAVDLKYEFLKREAAAGYALRIEIEKCSQVCSASDGTVYVRHGAQSLSIRDTDRIQQLNFAKGATSFEDMPMTDLPAEAIVESRELAEFLSDYSPKTDPLDFTLGQNLLHYKTWQPRVVAALLFHSDPSAVVPRKCAIKISRYETKEDDPEREHLAKQATIEGPSYQLIHSAVKEVTTIMSSIQVWTTTGLKRLEYPAEAIWETIVNAVIHRDYSISDDIHILIFDNRIEILSPGRLPGYVNIENILDARFARNPKMVRTLNRYKNPPNKDLGEGLNTTFQKMKEFGLKSPEIVEEGGYLKVTLPHLPLAAPTVAILEFLKVHDQITNRQARDLTGIRSENLVKIEFYKLRDEGHIERVPELAGPRSAWRLTQQGRDFIRHGDTAQ